MRESYGATHRKQAAQCYTTPHNVGCHAVPYHGVGSRALAAKKQDVSTTIRDTTNDDSYSGSDSMDAIQQHVTPSSSKHYTLTHYTTGMPRSSTPRSRSRGRASMMTHEEQQHSRDNTKHSTTMMVESYGVSVMMEPTRIPSSIMTPTGCRTPSTTPKGETRYYVCYYALNTPQRRMIHIT